MNVLFICDKENKTKASIDLYEKLSSLFSDKGYEGKTIEVGKKDLASCMGCFGCWIKTPGECVVNDLMTDINKSFINSDVVVYLSPIVFGQFSATMKNAVDRWLPNVLPFFEKVNGVTKHPKRYDKDPNTIVIGYGDDLSEEEKSTFIDINRHRGDMENIFVCVEEDKNNELVEKISKCL